MQSDYSPEHKAAAKEFIKEGFPTNVLFSLIQKFQQPNLVSMYFYISGKRTDTKTQNAWNYLRQRIEAIPDSFISNTYSPEKLSPENRYLTSEKNHVFFSAP